MGKDISESISSAVEREKTSREYAENFYEVESSMEPLFALDTKILDSIIKPGSRVMVAMMARGRHVVHYAKKGCEVWANDHNEHMVKLVKEEVKAQGLKATVQCLDVTDMKGVPEDYFDYVICMYSSLGCIPGKAKRLQAMMEFNRIVKPGGLVVVHAHARLGAVGCFRDALWAIKDIIGLRESNLERGDYYFFHSNKLGYTFNHTFSASELKKKYADADLKVVRRFYLNLNQDGFARFKPLTGGFIFVGKKLL